MRRLVFALMFACGILTTGVGCDKMPWASKDDKKDDSKGDKKKKGKGEDKKKKGDDDDDDDSKKSDKKKGDDDDDDNAKKGDDDDDDTSTGVKECDDYIKAYTACGKNMPKEAQKQWNDSIKQQISAFKQAGKAAAAGCKASADSLKDNPSCKK